MSPSSPIRSEATVIYERLLRGEATPEEYAAQLKIESRERVRLITEARRGLSVWQRIRLSLRRPAK